jgi:hypothetical protein
MSLRPPVQWVEAGHHRSATRLLMISGCCTLQIRGGRDPNNVTQGQKMDNYLTGTSCAAVHAAANRAAATSTTICCRNLMASKCAPYFSFWGILYIVMHITKNTRSVKPMCPVQFSGSLRVNDALCPSKSGQMNKHIVKHIVMPCTRPSPD